MSASGPVLTAGMAPVLREFTVECCGEKLGKAFRLSVKMKLCQCLQLISSFCTFGSFTVWKGE